MGKATKSEEFVTAVNTFQLVYGIVELKLGRSDPRARALDKQDFYKVHSYLVLTLCLLL